jgi:hypothetical protein
VHCNSAQSDPHFGHIPSTLSANRKRKKTTTPGMSTRSISKITSRISVCTDPRGCAVLRRGSSAATLLRLRIRIPPGEWMSVSCEFCVLSGTGLCVELITRPEESYWVWCVCDSEAQIMRPWPTRGCYTRGEKKFGNVNISISVIVFGTKSILQSKMFKFVWNLRLFTVPMRI